MIDSTGAASCSVAQGIPHLPLHPSAFQAFATKLSQGVYHLEYSMCPSRNLDVICVPLTACFWLELQSHNIMLAAETRWLLTGSSKSHFRCSHA